MKNGVPSSLNIAGKRYSVTVTELDDKLGHIVHDAQAIRVHGKQHSDALKDTLLHEAIHALDYQAQLEMTERQVHVLAAGICDVLWRNPQFATWLLAR